MDDDFMMEDQDNQLDDKKHNKLIESIAGLDGQQSRKPNQRSVISKSISEFNFGTSQVGHGKVKLDELVHSLQDKALDKTLRKKIKDIQQNKVVPVPTPKHEKEKIQRTVAYEKTTDEISKWDPIVNHNRLADQIVFPLDKPNVKVLTTHQLVRSFKPRTPLEVQVAAMLGKSDHVIKNPNDDLTPAEKRALQAMDVSEAQERRKELMKHRYLLSYKEARAKREKRIKSKKHHRVVRKQNQKREDKMLAEMQKNDPEGFLEKMKMLEKQRVEERMSLKHRGGSRYIQRQKMFAKYDDKARQQVQNMLQFSHELTKKQEVDLDDDHDLFMEEEKILGRSDLKAAAGDNMEARQQVQNMLQFSRELTKKHEVDLDDDHDDLYMEEEKILGRFDLKAAAGDNMEARQQVQNMLQFSRELTKKHEVDLDDDNDDLYVEEEPTDETVTQDGGSNPWMTKQKLKVKNSANTRTSVSAFSGVPMFSTKDSESDGDSQDIEVLSTDKISFNIHIDETKHDTQKAGEKNSSTKKKEEIRNKEDEIEAIFKKIDSNQNKKNLKKKDKKKKNKNSDKVNDDAFDSDNGKSNEHDVPNTSNSNKVETNNDIDDDEDLDNLDKSTGGIEEGLQRKRTLEDFSDDDSDVEMTPVKKLRGEKADGKDSEGGKKSQEDAYIDPNKLMMIESKIHRTGEGLDIVDDEDDNDDDQRMMIAQAFADDDVVEEFTAEKEEDIEQKTVKDIDLSLPGWGEWGGEGVKPRKKKNLIVKAPPQQDRPDKQLGHVIINQEKSKNILKHQVNSIPFPYTSGQQFEASIKQPIGQTWNTPNSFMELTKPKVVTKIGSIITPLDKQKAFAKDNVKGGSKMPESKDKKMDEGDRKQTKEKKGNKKHRKAGKGNKSKKK